MYQNQAGVAHSAMLAYYYYYYTGWAKKNGLFFRLDNFVTVSPRKACNFIEKKVQNWHFNEFKYFLPDLLKSSQQLKLCYI